MSRFLLVVLVLAATAGAVVAYGDPEQIARASTTVSDMLRQRAAQPARAVQIARGVTGEFALRITANWREGLDRIAARDPKAGA